MKTTYISLSRLRTVFALLAFVLFGSGCIQDETPMPSPDKPDPFARIDNPNSPVDHEIYLYYKESGVPILYNDTLSADPFVKLNIQYQLTAMDTLVHYSLLKSSDDILAGLEFIKAKIVPNLGASMKPYSFFLTDSLYRYASHYSTEKVMLPAYKSLKTTVIGHLSDIADMDAEALQAYRHTVLKTILVPYLSGRSDLMADFFAVSADYYGKRASGAGNGGSVIAYKPKEEYGLLSTGEESPTTYEVGEAAEDLDRYLSVTFLLSDEAFRAQYDSFPLVMKKYEVLIEALSTLDFTMPRN